MALRLAAVAALVLALARPMIRSSWLGHTTEREVILVLDNSLSMSREIDGQSAGRPDEGAGTGNDRFAFRGDGCRCCWPRAANGRRPRAIAADSARQAAAARDRGGRRADAGHGQFAGVLAGGRAFAGARTVDRPPRDRVHRWSGEQLEGRFRRAPGSNWRPSAKRPSIPISLEVVDCGLEATEVDNLAVTGIRAVRNLVRPGEQVELAADITNMGDVRERGDARRVAGGRKGGAESHGEGAGAAREDASDGFGADERRRHLRRDLPHRGRRSGAARPGDSLVVEVADQLPILFVRRRARRAPAVAAPELICRGAWISRTSEAQSWHSVFRPEMIAPAALASHPLADYRAIVINNPGVLDRTAIERLDSFVRAGGGLWVALGDEIDKTQFNRDWYSDGDGLSPLELDSLEVIDKTDDVAATVHPPSRDHPATLQLANTTQLDIDEARIRERWVFGERHGGRRGRVVAAGIGQRPAAGGGEVRRPGPRVGAGVSAGLGVEQSAAAEGVRGDGSRLARLCHCADDGPVQFDAGHVDRRQPAGGRPRRHGRAGHAARPVDFARGHRRRHCAGVSLHANLAAGNVPRAIHERRQTGWRNAVSCGARCARIGCANRWRRRTRTSCSQPASAVRRRSGERDRGSQQRYGAATRAVLGLAAGGAGCAVGGRTVAVRRTRAAAAWIWRVSSSHD